MVAWPAAHDRRAAKLDVGIDFASQKLQANDLARRVETYPRIDPSSIFGKLNTTLGLLRLNAFRPDGGGRLVLPAY